MHDHKIASFGPVLKSDIIPLWMIIKWKCCLGDAWIFYFLGFVWFGRTAATLPHPELCDIWTEESAGDWSSHKPIGIPAVTDDQMLHLSNIAVCFPLSICLSATHPVTRKHTRKLLLIQYTFVYCTSKMFISTSVAMTTKLVSCLLLLRHSGT